MTHKQNNYLCLTISVLPFLISVILQKSIIKFPSTHLFTNNDVNPAEIDKPMFIFLILLSGIGFYIISMIVSRYLSLIPIKLNIVFCRYLLNCTLSLLILILVLQNLK
jgi:hypothetical protein